MNKKGFTLVELLATIVILGIIASIAMVSITKIVDHSKKVECENLLLSMKSAAKEYVSHYRFDKTESSLKTIYISTLVNEGFLTSSITDPFGKKEVDTGKVYVRVTLNNDFTYKSAEVRNNVHSVINCANGKANGKAFPLK